MINPITSFITSNPLSTIAQSTSTSVTIETTMKAIGRPGFILIDNNISPDTKKYAAAKEFLYQATCLILYATIVVPLFKNGAFKLAPKIFKHRAEEFAQFANPKQFAEYRKYAKLPYEDRVHNTKIDKVLPEKLAKYLHTTKETPEQYDTIKGTIEAGSLIGSVIGLAILAPQISHAIIHPALRLIGMEEPQKHKNNNTNNHPKTINTNA